ncbi:MAG: hypothetical protein V4739_13060 [Pseudomonadota bacterium]
MIPSRLDKPLLAGTAAARSAGADPARRFRAALSTPITVSQNLSLDPADASGDAQTDLDEPPAGLTDDLPELHDLRELWDKLVLTLQAGRRLSGDHWTLRLRLDETAFPLTSLTLACTAGELSVTLCTVSDTQFARLQSQLPALNQRLQRHAGTGSAVVRQVPLEELDP